MMKNDAPKRFQEFTSKYPAIAEAYSLMGDAVHKAGPLDAKTRALVKIALSGGAKMEGAFHSHVRKARMIGVSREEIEHIAFLALPTLGFPTMIALLSWIDDVYKKD